MKELMIDIETLDTAKTAVVFQVGCIMFDDKPGYFEELLIDLPAQHQLENWRTISPETLHFWSDSSISNILQESLTKSLKTVEPYLPPDARIKTELAKVSEAASCCSTIWAKSFFDFEILENLFEQMEIKCPWHNGKRRDLLTLMKECGVKKPVEGNPHHALEDCRQQVEQLRMCREIIAVSKVQTHEL